jgi:L-tartrate/succinate antiporter
MALPQQVVSLPQPQPEAKKPRFDKALAWRAGIPLAAWVGITLLPVPAGLDFRAWAFFALFCGVILGLVLEPMPAAAVGLLGVVAATVFRLPFGAAQVAAKGFNAPAEAVRWALAGFTNTTVWLIFAAFMFALGYEKTGLGRRIALGMVRWLGKRPIGLGYALMLSDLVLAPFTPSNTARSGGIIFPIARNIPPIYGSTPGPTSRKIGAYLIWTAVATQAVTSSMFLTALAPNLLAVELTRKIVKVDIGWTQWALGFLPVGLVLLAVLPLLVYWIYPPELKRSPEVAAWAAGELREMGPIKRTELGMAALVVLALGLWIFGRSFLDATSVALLVIALMVIGRIVAWDDIVGNKGAWNILVWFATLVTLADGLARVGFVGWFAKGAAGVLDGFSPMTVMIALVVLFFFVHYMFASSTAHTTAVLPVVLAAGAAVPGVPVAKFAMLLCYALGLMGVISPYATGPSPIWYGSGYVGRRDFWLLGLVFGLIFLGALLVIGVPYLMAMSI